LTDFGAVTFALTVFRPVVSMAIFIRARASAAKKFSRVFVCQERETIGAGSEPFEGS